VTNITQGGLRKQDVGGVDEKTLVKEGQCIYHI